MMNLFRILYKMKNKFYQYISYTHIKSTDNYQTIKKDTTIWDIQKAKITNLNFHIQITTWHQIHTSCLPHKVSITIFFFKKMI